MNSILTDCENIPNRKRVIKQSIHVEILLKSHSNVNHELLEKEAKGELNQYLKNRLTTFESKLLSDNVEYISMPDIPSIIIKNNTPLKETNLFFHIFRLHDSVPEDENLTEDEDLPATSNWMLPSRELDGLWESLIYEPHVKEKLVNYATLSLHYADHNVNDKIISWNKVVLLHGPPGTGKTSLCKALAQKLSIRFTKRYKYGSLLEINSHSLFSKWFSESGKLVMKLFQKIEELVEDENAFVFILIDEVESLTTARHAHNSGVEPSDAIRVVNSLLNQLDKIRRYRNVMILTTSNITGKIDLAFLDRADIKQYIGPPSPFAIYEIYKSCIQELRRVFIIKKHCIFVNAEEASQLFKSSSQNQIQEWNSSKELYAIAEKSFGLSGRTLRKLPFLAQSSFVQTAVMSTADFLAALSMAVDMKIQEKDELIC